ncbi:hypothetical protein [Plastoroseomonas hellenica]|uniref:Transposase n=1 Tax=Plastoroseomonas hellenica TaxID=2687306 RepID=A0ABS5F3S0_9PROT|nr:hypothetical protein [Plastoroseomonas hellenica]MBR0645958.1 hypothetical protein [Plastoroseomonas hellenica]MBR0667171.1 hypothetical protein [Plastoroseomonas hellenica]
MALRDSEGSLADDWRSDHGAKRLVITVVDKPSPAAAYQILEVDPASGERVPLAISFANYVDAFAVKRALDRDYRA